MMGGMFTGGMSVMFLIPIGIIFVCFGLFVLAKRGRLPIVRRETSETATKSEESIEARIIKLAAKHEGALTVTDAVLETGLGIQQIEEVLNGMVDGLRVTMSVEDSGIIVYEFREIVERGSTSKRREEIED